jgi:hypothetical protein
MNIQLALRTLGLCAISLLVAGSDCETTPVDTEPPLDRPPVDTVGPPDTLTVLDHNDTLFRGTGDEVAVGRIRFHAIFGEPGATQVIVDDRLDELDSDVSNGGVVTLPEDLIPIGQLDFGGVPVVDWEDDIMSYDASVAISGSIALAIERDRKGTDTARSRMADAAATLYDALDFYIAGPSGILSGLSEEEKLRRVAEGFYCVQAVQAGVMLPSLCSVHPDHPEWSDAGGGLSFGESLRKWFKSWFSNVGHDLISVGGVISLNVAPDDFDAKLALIRLAAPAYDVPREAIPPCDDPSAEPPLVLCPPRDRPVSIHFKGEDAHWRIDTHVVPPPY